MTHDYGMYVYIALFVFVAILMAYIVKQILSGHDL